MKSGLTSLYLDVYVGGKRTYEYLRMYLIPEKNRADKEKNRQTLLLAEAVRAQRVVELRNGMYGFRDQSLASKIRFFDYYRGLCDRRHTQEGMGNWRIWICCLRYLERYEKRQNITLADIDKRWIEGFVDYLNKSTDARVSDASAAKGDALISNNTKHAYYARLRACLKQAVEDGILDRDPSASVTGFKPEEGTRMYLTVEELKRLVDTECRHTSIKTAFLFSCFTGLRRSDIIKMKWSDVYKQGEYTRVIFKQQKTNGLEYLDITPQAAELMGERGAPDNYVFDDIHSPSCTNSVLQEWVARAGIKKKISFHCARHTFATMMLDLGNDLYTVSKLLGHREIHTTQIYTKVMDKNRRAAVAKIPRILPERETKSPTLPIQRSTPPRE